jgi:hypothetical protein
MLVYFLFVFEDFSFHGDSAVDPLLGNGAVWKREELLP